MQSELRTNKNWFTDLLRACWGVINFTRNMILNIVFLLILAVILMAFAASQPKPIDIKTNSVLKLAIVGDVVEELTFVDPYDEVVNDALGRNNRAPETLLVDVLETLEYAETDDNIQSVLLDLQGLRSAGLSKLQEIGIAINRFKENSGKPVIAYGDYFSQGQYYLASHADKIVLHPMGAIGLDGFGRYRMYYKSALEKLKINSHVFSVGTYKSAVEPYLRDSMSDAAKESNKLWMGQLWDMYKADVTAARQASNVEFVETFDGFLSKFRQVDGDFGQFALQNMWVDELMNHQQFDQFMADQYGINKKVRYVDNRTYLAYIGNQLSPETTNANVAIVVAKGTIYDGKRKPGEIGGHSTAELLKKARKDRNVKAVVLRVDSPGGSAFASEIIRNEIEQLKQAGKPVVVSMSSLAASGGYWISASADEIWAAPTTITGSIGIFGMFMTFEDTLSEYLGIHTDGVATTEMAGLSPYRKLDPQMGDVIQLAIEQGYDRFISLVADEREMSKVDVDKVAQGRVWSGQTAHEFGLVDKLGYFQDAINSAASMAELDDYQIKYMRKSLSPMEMFMQELFESYGPTPEVSSVKAGELTDVLQQILSKTSNWTKFNDPMGMYVYCLECGEL